MLENVQRLGFSFLVFWARTGMNIDVLIEAIKGTQGPLRYHQEIKNKIVIPPADQLQREYPRVRGENQMKMIVSKLWDSTNLTTQAERKDVRTE